MATIGRRIRAARTAAALSQSQLALRSGIAQAAISRIERDETHDSGILVVAAIARALDISLDELVQGNSRTRPQRNALEQRVAALECAVAALQEAAGAGDSGVPNTPK